MGEEPLPTLELLALSAAMGAWWSATPTFDHHSFINNLLILPLIFLGGVFHSIDIHDRPGWDPSSTAASWARAAGGREAKALTSASSSDGSRLTADSQRRRTTRNGVEQHQ